MNIRCEQLDDLLFEGDRLSLEVAATHAASCPECAEKLADWNEISGTAATMQESWQSDLLLPRIQRSLRDEKRAPRGTFWRIAAAVALTVGLAAGSFWAIRTRSDQAFDRVILPIAAFDDAERAEQAHVRAIAQLERLAEPSLENETALMVSYREKLMLLDDAIAECRTNIDRNRQNAHLRKQLLAMYSEKQRTLQEVAREGNHESNQ